MSEETDDAKLKGKLVLDPSIHMTRDDVTEAIQQWIHENYGVIVPNFMVKFLEDCQPSEISCHEVMVHVRLSHDDVRDVLNRYEGIGPIAELEDGE